MLFTLVMQTSKQSDCPSCVTCWSVELIPIFAVVKDITIFMRAVHLQVLEKILLLGADLDQRTRYGMNARE